MSRCFPYNPLSRCEKSKALIEPIKLQKREKAQEKKQRKIEKKLKVTGGIDGKTEDAKHGHMKRHHGKRDQPDEKSKCHPKANKDESEQLEKSELTEEHDVPYLPSTRGQDSPDSSQYCKKRKIEAPDLNRISHGSLLLRIKVPTLKLKEQKQEQPGPALATAESPCFSGRTEAAIGQGQQQQQQRFLDDGVGRHESFCGSKRSRRREAKYKDLFANWEPQSLQMENPLIDDQDWLFGTTGQQQRHHAKSCQVENELSFDANALSAWPPRACLLPEADIYLLPFVVPF